MPADRGMEGFPGHASESFQNQGLGDVEAIGFLIFLMADVSERDGSDGGSPLRADLKVRG